MFLKALKSVEEAKSFFLFDGFVTDHVHLLRDTSRLYRHLAIFEQVALACDPSVIGDFRMALF